MADLKTIKKVLSEATGIASIPAGGGDGGKVIMTQLALGNKLGKGIQISNGRQFVRLDKDGAKNIGRLLIKWAATQ